jgi:3-methylcrotonyl-CoA carboxylase alpha subunit
MFNKILIANRGEIACRIIRTARRLGIRTVAVYSEADARSLHVEMADESHLIGPPPARDSYLSIPRIVTAARASDAQAIHPGYGFLSENADFAEACTEAGIVFIGPSAASIRAIGDKAEAKAIMARAGIATVPGYQGTAQDAAIFAAAAERLGYPVLIKATAGGGGRGMRVVTAPAELAAALDSACNEATSAFGNGRLILEKYLAHPRHLEVQVFGDQHGNLVHLFERDCSAQRRHQKVIEESPAPTPDDGLRGVLGATAVAAARAVDYVGAGTVEFILQGRDFYFIEMNTRLQVEHPVTEMVTGYDLVEWQFAVAAGAALPVRQEEIRTRGHAIEARLYAEDPAHDFLPASGRLAQFRLPDQTSDLRIETGLREGDEIGIFYDALLAKLIAWGPTRTGACHQLDAALSTTEIGGIAHNRDFLVRLVRHRAFAEGAIDTGFIDAHRAALTLPLSVAPLSALAAASLALLQLDSGADHGAVPPTERDVHSPWSLRDGWRLSGETEYTMHWMDQKLGRRLTIRFHRSTVEVISDDDSVATVANAELTGTNLTFSLDAAPIRANVQRKGSDFTITLAGQRWQLTYLDPLAGGARDDLASARLVAPVHGRVLKVPVSAGASVKRGQVLMLLECMKLEYRVTAPADGVVEALHFSAGDVVQEGAQLLEFAPSSK